jgi:hypothetical protein
MSPIPFGRSDIYKVVLPVGIADGHHESHKFMTSDIEIINPTIHMANDLLNTGNTHSKICHLKAM